MLFRDWLNDDSKIVLFDGGFGTELLKRGILKPGKVPDILNLEKPEIIIEIHKSYYNAGSDMCQTNTFGSTPLNLRKHNLEDQIKEIIEHALDNIKTACPSGNLIVGDIGPTGEFRPPVGTASSDEWYSSFKTQAKILEKGVDLYHIETISDLEEILTAVHAVKEVSNKPIIASITYKKTKRGFFTIMGDSLEKCIKALELEEVDVIGANCTLGSSEMVDLAKEAKKITDYPISVKPNAGQPRIVGTETFYDQPTNEFVNDIQEMIKLGVKVVGGCCGTSPETIQEIRKIIDSK
ncbi:MAG: homocysteine S-methyltransferase family protein [Promethearchaeota archaeon]|jgi:5-methyltetrahydrofolate--homocysteine methyltransferase